MTKKIHESDQGASLVKIYTAGEAIIVDFGKSVSWFGLDAPSALELGTVLVNYSQILESRKPAEEKTINVAH